MGRAARRSAGGRPLAPSGGGRARSPSRCTNPGASRRPHRTARRCAGDRRDAHQCSGVDLIARSTGDGDDPEALSKGGQPRRCEQRGWSEGRAPTCLGTSGTIEQGRRRACLATSGGVKQCHGPQGPVQGAGWQHQARYIGLASQDMRSRDLSRFPLPVGELPMHYPPHRNLVPGGNDASASHCAVDDEQEAPEILATVPSSNARDGMLGRFAPLVAPAPRTRGTTGRLAVVALSAMSATAACGGPPPVNAPTARSTPEAPAAPEPPATQGQASPTSREPTRGAADAPVTITEFAEFYCPFCALYLWETYPQIERDYVRTGQVKYVFHNLVVHGPSALLASAAGECAQAQGRFWTFHDHMFEQIFPGRNVEETKELDLGQLEGMGGSLELDAPTFSHCLQDTGATMTRCNQEQQRCVAAGTAETSCTDARNRCLMKNPMLQRIAEDKKALGRFIAALPADELPLVERIGTPTFFVNGHVLVGAAPYEEFKALIDRELARAKSQ